uniref:WD repeat-containing protein 55 homolog n=1 Tax=Strongyloides venezuelensis TaxID=75913 RepID=A0A0K0G4B0_STRVS
MEPVITIPVSVVPKTLTCIKDAEKNIAQAIRKYQLEIEPLDVASKGSGAHHYAFMPHVDLKDCKTKISRILEICSFREGNDPYKFFVAAICPDAIHLFKGVDFKRNRKFPYVSLKYLDCMFIHTIKIHLVHVIKSISQENVVFLQSLGGKVVQVILAGEVGRIICNEIPIPKTQLERCLQYHSSTDSVIYVSGKETINIMKIREDKPNFSQPINYGKTMISMGMLAPDMRSYVIATTDGTIFVVDALTGYKRHKVDSFQHRRISAMAVLNDNVHLILGFYDGTLLKITTEENTEDSVVGMFTAHHSAITTIVVQKESYIDRFATLNNGTDKLLIIWSGKNNLPLQRFHFTEKIQFNCLEFLTDSNVLFVGSSEGHVLLFKMTDEEEVCEIMEKVHKQSAMEDEETFHDTTLEKICRMDTTVVDFTRAIDNYNKNGGFEGDYEIYGNSFEAPEPKFKSNEEEFERMQMSSDDDSQQMETNSSFVSNENSTSQPKFSPTNGDSTSGDKPNTLPQQAVSVFGNISDSDDD